nr:MAG: hypothetical protein [Bacteriophage sp.]
MHRKAVSPVLAKVTDAAETIWKFRIFLSFLRHFIPLFFKRLFEYKNNSRTNFLSCSTAPKMIQYVLPEYSISPEMYKRRLGTPMPGRFFYLIM